jgi:MinD superfamily P-loop ATPase
MVIAIASGKGGTGKTTVAVGLALAFRAAGRRVQLIDCDVEEPNCHLFLAPTIRSRVPVNVPVPRVDADRCTRCGHCARVCEFGAIACLKEVVVVFTELCHSCGACVELCPENAIGEVEREVGTVATGDVNGLAFVTGRLNVGEPRAVPVIDELKQRVAGDAIAILDAPPGTSCPVVAAIKGVDLVLLVAEPTPFGLNDLRLMVEGVAALDIPWAIVVNRVGIGDARVRQFARERGIPVLAEIPNDRRIAEAQSRGEPAYGVSKNVAALFGELAAKLEGQVSACGS